MSATRFVTPVGTPKMSPVMKRGRKEQKLLLKTLTMGQKFVEDEPPYCFSCEQMFPDRMWLEEHACPAASYICSCGTEFGFYTDMLEHSKKHEPGHKVLDHQTILKRRLEKHKEQDEQLERLEANERRLWSWPRPDDLPSSSLANKSTPKQPMLSALNWKDRVKAAPILKVPAQSPSLAKVPFLSKPISIGGGNTNLTAGPAAPTVDLWTIYQPVVLVNTVRQFDKDRPYKCGTCELTFQTQRNLNLHFNIHTKDKIFGCLGCGVLLSSKKSVPRLHHCNSPSSSLKTRLITAMPMKNKKPVLADQNKSQNKSHNLDHRIKNLNPLPSFTVIPPKPKLPALTVADLLKKTRDPNFGVNGHKCRVCHITFASILLLQRHKCAKAQEFVEKQALLGKNMSRYRKMATVKGPYPSIQIKGNESRLPPPSTKMAGLDNGLRVTPAAKKSDVVLDDDDCYIVDSSPAKPTQMFYQLTSSLPVIKI